VGGKNPPHALHVDALYRRALRNGHEPARGGQHARLDHIHETRFREDSAYGGIRSAKLVHRPRKIDSLPFHPAPPVLKLFLQWPSRPEAVSSYL